MLIYNTLTEKKEIFEKADKRLKLFVCGPTVYDYSHIGHARTYIAFDVIANHLRSLGYKLFYLQNITDIDDKIINRANNEKKSTQEIASFFTKEYLKDVKALAIKSVNKYAPASKYIKAILRQISQLLDKGYAYKTSSGVYFEIKKFSDYGKLSKQDLNAIRSGWRIELDPEKKDPMDFALWKFKKQHANSAPSPNGFGNANAPMRISAEPSWKSPWGEGRPGWHIEDTAITEKFFGPQYDLHGGALDLKFPHHESEIAQQEAISGKKPMVRFWLHTGFVLVDGEKMSKSLGNFITIRDFLKKHSSDILRYLIISHHYRSPIDYTEQLAIDAQNALKNITQFLAKLSLVKNSAKIENANLIIESSEIKFQAAMSDDFNTPVAFAAIFNLINEVNPKIWDLSKKDAKKIIKWVQDRLNTFKIGVKLLKIPLKIRLLAKKRELLRVNKQFTKADDLRKKINALGYSIEDTPEGPLVLILNE